MSRMQPSVDPSGYVRVSQAAELDAVAVPPVLYSREGVLFVPENGNRFARPAHQSEILAPAGDVLSEGENHITKAGRVRIGELSAGLSANFPRRFAVGDAGTSPGTSSPLPPNDLATALIHEIARVDVSQRVMNVDVPSVTFVGLFRSSGSYQFNQPGQAVISETGLFTTDGVLCSIYNFAPIPVDVHRLGVLIEWEWSIL